MKLLLPLLLAPVISLAAATGSVTLLDGTPIAGAVVKSQTDSVTTSATGTFVLGRTTGIASQFAKTIAVTSNLVIENRRPRLSFSGMDIAGRTRSTATARQNLSSTGTCFAARSTGTPDTLKVYWKGKRLTVLPVTSDTTVTFRIDTAWKDDAGIPWNPSIAYGSLYDARDGQTYRTVTIGSQTWMAENLALRGTPDSVGIPGEPAFGRYYRRPDWSDALCPGTGWRLPAKSHWDSLTLFLNRASNHAIQAGTALKSRNGWNGEGDGTDGFGFRGLPAGMILSLAPSSLGNAGFWALRRDTAQIPMLARLLSNAQTNSPIDTGSIDLGVSIRCLKD